MTNNHVERFVSEANEFEARSADSRIQRCDFVNEGDVVVVILRIDDAWKACVGTVVCAAGHHARVHVAAGYYSSHDKTRTHVSSDREVWRNVSELFIEKSKR